MKKILVLLTFPIEFAPVHRWLTASDVELHFLVGDTVLTDAKPVVRKGLMKAAASLKVIKEYRKNNQLLLIASELIKNHGISHIVSLDESDVEKSAVLRTLFGLYGQQYASAIAYRDKEVMKKTLKKVVSIPQYEVVDSSSGMLHACKRIGFPSVLKSASGAMSINVEQFHDMNAVLSYLGQNSIVGKHLLEEFIDGEMFHVDGISLDGKLAFAGVSKYYNRCMNYKKDRVLGGCMLPVDDPDSLNLVGLTRKVLSGLPAHPGGAFHAEFWKVKDKYIFCEIAARMGGGGVRSCVLKRFGVDLLEAHAKIAAGRKWTPPKKLKNDAKIYGWLVLSPCKGTLVHAEESCPVKNVAEYEIKGKIGTAYSNNDRRPITILNFITVTKSLSSAIGTFEELQSWANDSLVWA